MSLSSALVCSPSVCLFVCSWQPLVERVMRRLFASLPLSNCCCCRLAAPFARPNSLSLPQAKHFSKLSFSLYRRRRRRRFASCKPTELAYKYKREFSEQKIDYAPSNCSKATEKLPLKHREENSSDGRNSCSAMASPVPACCSLEIKINNTPLEPTIKTTTTTTSLRLICERVIMSAKQAASCAPGG